MNVQINHLHPPNAHIPLETQTATIEHLPGSLESLEHAGTYECVQLRSGCFQVKAIEQIDHDQICFSRANYEVYTLLPVRRTDIDTDVSREHDNEYPIPDPCPQSAHVWRYNPQRTVRRKRSVGARPGSSREWRGSMEDREVQQRLVHQVWPIRERRVSTGRRTLKALFRTNCEDLFESGELVGVRGIVWFRGGGGGRWLGIWWRRAWCRICALACGSRCSARLLRLVGGWNTGLPSARGLHHRHILADACCSQYVGRPPCCGSSLARLEQDCSTHGGQKETGTVSDNGGRRGSGGKLKEYSGEGMHDSTRQKPPAARYDAQRSTDSSDRDLAQSAF